MNILVVGAGAVGQVYGRYLSLGGARVHYFVKEKYAAEYRKGFTFYDLNHQGRAHPIHHPIASDEIITQIAEVKKMNWDQVFICVSSAALHSGSWLQEIAQAIGNATVVTLQPGPEDREVLLRFVPVERLVTGMITLISYHAPLPGEQVPEPGMAYWFPPLSAAPFSGPKERTTSVIQNLKQGRFPVRWARDVPAQIVFPSTIFMTLIAALQAGGWSFHGVFQGNHLTLARRATRESIAITENKLHRRSPPGIPWLLHSWIVRLIILGMKILIPIPMETYLRVHFTKVNDQMRMYMQSYIRWGHQLGLPTQGLEELDSRCRGVSV
jgi:2-dehydropantoate 2-reductase